MTETFKKVTQVYEAQVISFVRLFLDDCEILKGKTRLGRLIISRMRKMRQKCLLSSDLMILVTVRKIDELTLIN